MSYSESFFCKPLKELLYDDIEKFFTVEQDETNLIEFKCYVDTSGGKIADKEVTIMENICALLNSEGGLIIWGAPVGIVPEGKKTKVYSGALSPVTEIIERDRFMQRVNSMIVPSPIGVSFQAVSKGKENVYIIEVKKSSFSPHQLKNTYWMRIDGHTVPAPHSYIEALFRRISFPRLEGYIKLTGVNFTHDYYDIKRKKYIISFSYLIFNQSALQNEHDINCRLIVSEGNFIGFGNHIGVAKYYPNGKELVFSPAKTILFYGEPLLETESIEIYLESINPEFEVYIGLFFGGKSSPMMASEYVISLKSMPLGEYDINSHFISINENQYLHEKKTTLGITDKDAVKKILGR